MLPDLPHPAACARHLFAAVLALLVVLPPALAAERQDPPQAWKLDPVHTRVLFAVSHAGFSHALGTVSGSDGGLRFDPQDWTGARLVVEVPLARLDLGNAGWNEAAQAANLLDVARFPTARFVSSTVTASDPSHAQVCGELTLHGVSRPLCLAVTVNAVERHPMPPFRLTAGFSATATLSRSDFGIDAWSSMIGDEVELRIEAEATRASTEFAERLFGPTDPPAESTPAETSGPEPAERDPAASEPASDRKPATP